MLDGLAVEGEDYFPHIGESARDDELEVDDEEGQNSSTTNSNKSHELIEVTSRRVVKSG